MEISKAVQLAIVFSGVFLWIGMLTGVWKYWQIRRSELSRAHYYVDIAQEVVCFMQQLHLLWLH